MQAAGTAVAAEFKTVAIGQLEESKTNPRQHFAKDALSDLIASVKEKGILVPLLVRPINPQSNGFKNLKTHDGYEILAGARRYRAAKAAGLASVPVLIRELDDTQALEVQVIENLQRADVHPLEEAKTEERRAAVRWAIEEIDHDHVKPICEAMGWEPKKASWGGKDYTGTVMERVEKLPIDQAERWINFAAVAIEDLWFGAYLSSIPKSRLLFQAAKHAKVNLAEINKAVAAKWDKKAKPAKVKASAKPQKAPKAKAA